MSITTRLFTIFIVSIVLPSSVGFSEESGRDSEARLKLQFLGDQGHHQPARRASELLPALEERGIDVEYTEDIEATLSPDNLAKLDGLVVYANIDRISDQQAQALLNFVDGGGGFVPLHCASFCFRNHDEIVS